MALGLISQDPDKRRKANQKLYILTIYCIYGDKKMKEGIITHVDAVNCQVTNHMKSYDESELKGIAYMFNNNDALPKIAEKYNRTQVAIKGVINSFMRDESHVLRINRLRMKSVSGVVRVQRYTKMGWVNVDDISFQQVRTRRKIPTF